jgi:peptide-methionine (R)-S-oxide reductase
MKERKSMTRAVELSEEEWQQRLTPEQYRVLREAGTERAFSGIYSHGNDPGTYRCAGCRTSLFSSDAKYDSGSGWPSFWEAVDPEKVELRSDRSLGMTRVEALCATCGGHLGHVFPDGPLPSGERFCINSAALDFEAAPDTGHRATEGSIDHDHEDAVGRNEHDLGTMEAGEPSQRRGGGVTAAVTLAGVLQVLAGFLTVGAIGLIGIPLWGILCLVALWVAASLLTVRTARRSPLAASGVPVGNGLLLWAVTAAGQAWLGWLS